jgi:hypothetical protein
MRGQDRGQPRNRNGQGRDVDPRPGHRDQLEDTMPVSIRHRRTRPASAPAYYLGRPASFWIALGTRRRRASGARQQATWAQTARRAA